MSEDQIIAGKYSLIREIGAGGMAKVLLACQTGLDGFQKLVVIKQILPHLAEDPDFVQMFLDEARTAADLRHSNIVDIYEVGEDEGTLFIAMEYIRGQTVRRIQQYAGLQKKPVPVGAALQIVTDVARGLHYAHQKKNLMSEQLGIIHRDVSPHNVLVSYDGISKVLDFGIARAEGQQFQTQTGVVRGTVSYMSPEQATGGELDHRADQYSLGVILYELTTGTRLYGGRPSLETVAEGHIEPPTIRSGHYPTELEGIVMQALAHAPRKRFESCKALADALEEFIARAGIPHSAARVGEYVQDLFEDTYTAKEEISKTSAERIRESHSSSQRPLARADDVDTVMRPPPGRRNATPIVAGFLLIAAIVVLVVWGNRSPETASGARTSIVVADFVNNTKEPELDSLSGLFITALEGSQQLDVVTRQRMIDVLGRSDRVSLDKGAVLDAKRAHEVARLARIEHLAQGRVEKHGRTYNISLTLMDPASQSGVPVFSTRASGPQVPPLIDQLALDVRRQLKEGRREIARSQRPTGQAVTTNLHAYHKYFEAERAIADGDFDVAEVKLEEAIAEEPGFALAHYRLAYAHQWLGKANKDSIERAYAIVEADPGALPRKEYLMLDAIRARGSSATIEALELVLEEFPAEKEAVFMIGDQLYHNISAEMSVEYFERTLQMDPNFASAYDHLVRVEMQLGRHDAARAHLEEYLRRHRTSPAFWRAGNVYLSLGDLERAEAVYTEARTLFPHEPLSYEGLAAVHLFRGASREAEAEVDAWIRHPRIDAAGKMNGYRWQAQVFTYTGRFEQAHLAHLGRIANAEKLTDDSELARGHAAHATFLAWARRDFEGAEIALRKANELRSGDRYVLLHGALVPLAADDRETATLLAKGAWSAYKLPVLVDAHFGCRRGPDPESLAALEETTPLAEDILRPIFRSALADCYLEAGKPDAAIAMLAILQRELAFDEYYTLAFPTSLLQLGRAQEKAGRRAEAIQSYETLLSLWANADAELPAAEEARARLADLR